MADRIERELAWDDVIENDSPSYELLPEGEYRFTVTSVDRERYNGGEKLPACWVAKVSFEISDENTSNTILDRFYLHTKCEGKLCAFYTALGMRKHGEPLKMNWNIIGKTGHCKVGVKTYNGKQYNEIKSYIEPVAPAAASPSFGGWGK